jgi:hypothetical protein
VLIESLDHFAASWSSPRLPEPLGHVVVDPLLIRHVGRVSPMIDAQLDGLPGDVRERQVLYENAERILVLQHIAASLGPRRFARRSGLPLKVAERAALGKPLSRRNVTKGLRAFRMNGDEKPCALPGCTRTVSRPNALYCSPSHAKRAYRMRKRETECSA